MKKFLVGFVVMGLLLAVSPAIGAQSDDIETTTEQTVAEDRVADRQARIEEYKQASAERLSAAGERRVAAVCKAAQANLNRLSSNLDDVAERRRTAYANVSEKLATLVEKLQAASVDTTTLELVITEMNAKAAAIMSGITDYQTTLSDVAELDCEADPSAFNAALRIAREYRRQIVSNSTNLKTYVTDEIKPALADVRAALESTNTEGDA